MIDVNVEIKLGIACQQIVDAHYAQFGSRGRARPSDMFFLAMDRDQLVGCVRYSVEEETPMLRTMMIAEVHRRQGIGLRLLKEFARHLEQNNIHNVFCLPYPHLENFYGQIGFQRVGLNETPMFLQQRMAEHQNGNRTICMRRL